MTIIYFYIPDRMADWEIGHLISELNTGRYFRKDAQPVVVRTVASTVDTVCTMGGISIVPDLPARALIPSSDSYLVLPGGDSWNDESNSVILDKAEEIVASGGKVFAICGATVALAERGLLNDRRHTSNGRGFLEMFSRAYTGSDNYVDEPVVTDRNVTTAGGTNELLFAKEVIRVLGVFSDETLEAWYGFFSTGSYGQFMALMNSIKGQE